MKTILTILALLACSFCRGQTPVTIGYIDTARASYVTMWMQTDSTLVAKVYAKTNYFITWDDSLIIIQLKGDTTIGAMLTSNLYSPCGNGLQCCTGEFKLVGLYLPLAKTIPISTVSIVVGREFLIKDIVEPNFFINYYNGKKEKKTKNKAPKN